MEYNEMEKKIIEKADFYRINEIKVHVQIVPKPTFKNGLIVSELNSGNFFWFIENGVGVPARLFLSEIYDIEEYKEERG